VTSVADRRLPVQSAYDSTAMHGACRHRSPRFGACWLNLRRRNALS